MRYILMSAAFALSLTACDWNSERDYNPKGEFKAFVKKQNEAAKHAEQAAAAGVAGQTPPGDGAAPAAPATPAPADAATSAPADAAAPAPAPAQ